MHWFFFQIWNVTIINNHINIIVKLDQKMCFNVQYSSLFSYLTWSHFWMKMLHLPAEKLNYLMFVICCLLKTKIVMRLVQCPYSFSALLELKGGETHKYDFSKPPNLSASKQRWHVWKKIHIKHFIWRLYLWRLPEGFTGTVSVVSLGSWGARILGMLLGPSPPPLSWSESTSSTLTEGWRLRLELSEVKMQIVV